MPRHIAYKRTSWKYADMKGKVLCIKALPLHPGWFVPPGSAPNGYVQLLSLDNGSVTIASLNCIGRWLDRDELFISDELTASQELLLQCNFV